MIAAYVFAQGVIDVHSHIITPEFVSALEGEGRLMDEGFPLPKYDVENHLKWMDEAGVQTSVLTLAAPQPSSAEVVRQTNEAAARIKKEHPGRFLFCAALPLPDVSKAVEEAKYALDVLKADGIKLATNIEGQYLGAPELDTLFSVLNERKAVVILHPHRSEPVNRQVMQQTPLAMQEYLSETTRAVSNMIVRIAEIEVYPQYLTEYLEIANEVDRLSIEHEPGVICLYPMQSAEDSTKIRILEIYASEEAYQQHLKTDHFQKYKQGTLHMVKDLKLPTMKPLDPETMKQIFKKQR